MKYTPKIRLLSFLLCVILVFGLFPPLAAQAAQVSRIYTKEELATGGVSLIPQALTADSSFMGNYVNNGGRMSLNGHFSKYGSQNADGAGSNLPTGTIDGESSDHWYASYKWDPSQAQRDALNRGDVKLEFRANMIPVYSKHNYVFWKDEHWATAGIRLTRGDGNGNNTWVYGNSDYGWQTNGDIIFKALAEKVNSGQPQAVSQTWDTYPAGDKAMFYNAYYLREHNCCNPKTSGALFYAVETVAPTITGMDFESAKDGDSYTAIPRGGLTDTVTIHFSEKIRFADNAAHENIKLVLDAEYLDQSDKTGGFDITADFVEMDETYMKFRFTVREDYKHIKITGLDANQPDLMKETTLKVFDGNGDDLGASGLKATSVITDLAGNSLVYTRPYATEYYDGVAPTLSKIEMSGRDISAVSSEPTSWDDNSGNRRFIYGGAGDTITFQAVFSESVRVSDTGNVKAVLSIQDENGDPITLGWKDLDGNTVTFEDLVITEAMLDAGDRIYIEKIEGMSVADYAGNACVTSLTSGLTNTALVPAQSITLDVDKPIVSSSIPEDYLVSAEPLVYRPYAHSEGELFSFPVRFQDFDNNGKDRSGVAGMDMQFSLDMVDGGSYSYWWAMDTNQNVDESTQWKNGTTGSPNTFPDLAEERQYWVHIRLDPNVDYNYSVNLSAGVSGVRFDGTLNFSSVSDWAGNKATEGTSYTLRHQVDNKNPTYWSDTVKLTPDYDNGQVTFSTRILGRDTYGIKKISYRWQIKPWGSPESEYEYVNGGAWTEITPDEPGLNKEFWVEPSFTYDYTAEGAFRSGQVRVEAMVEDLAGNMAGGTSYIFKGRTGSFDYSLASSRSSVTNNKPSEPVAMPQITMREPRVPTGSTSENTPRSVLIIPLPDSMNAEGAYTEFYIWDPWHWDTNGVEGGEGEMQYVDNPITAIEGYLNDQTGLHPFDLAEIIQGSYYRAKGTVDTEANSASFESLNPYYSKNALEELQAFFSNYYGRMDLYIATTSSLEEFTYTGYVMDPEGWASAQSPEPEDLSFSGAQSTVQTYTVYLANNPAYKIVTESITNAEGLTDAENEAYKLDYSSSHRPAASLDNVAVTVQITNERDAGAALGEGFGLELLDYSYRNGAFRLYYTGSSYPGSGKPGSTPVATWNLVKTSDGRQTIVFAPGTCTENGWYTLWLETEDTHNGIAIEQKLGQFFLDATVLDVQAAAVEKSYYTAGESSESYEWKIGDVEAAAQESGAIKLGLAPTPEGWTMSEATISFRTEERPSDDPAEPANLSQIRVYNQTYNVQKGLALDAGEWKTAGEDWAQTHSYGVYLADLTEESPYTMTDEGGQTEYRLPFVAGRNLIVYERRSTNGVVTSHELVVDVAAEAEKWNLEYEVFYANRPGFATSAQVWPTGAYGEALELNAADDLDYTKYNFHQVNDRKYENTNYEDSYTYSDDVENVEYYLVDPNGNVSTKTLTIYDTDGTVLNIDSGEPYVDLSVDNSHPMYASSDSGYYSDYDGDGKTFYFTIEPSDAESSVDLREITLTFDEAYSAVLPGNCGTVGEDGRVTMPLPLALDENGELLKNTDGTYAVWEDFGTSHNGIFHTQVVETEEMDYWTEEMETVTRVHVFGTWRYSVTEEELAALGDTRTLTVNVYDAHGNVTSVSNTYLYDTSDAIGIGYPLPLDWQDGYILGEGLTPEGVVGLYSQVPYSSINGYGAEDMFAFVDKGHMGWRFYTWEAPMITQDSPVTGEDEWGWPVYEPYPFTVTDLFGQTFTVPVVVSDLYGELGIDVTFSTTEPTNQSVTVYANSTGNIEKIASIVASDGTVGAIDPLDPSKASITVSDNCTVTVTTDADPASERVVKVTNIDKTLGEAYVLYYDQDYRLLASGASAESVTAVLACDSEPLYATNGPESYTFPAGSKAGDSYTFAYQDAAGNTGTITAVLPVDLTAPVREDEDAPDVTVSLYAGQRDSYTFIDRFENPGYDETAQESQITAKLNDPDYGGVRARTFRLILTIDDASETKVVVAPAGSTAPTDYASATQGSTAQGVKLAVSRNTATVDVDQNTAFDIHIIDEKGLVTTLKQIRITSIDDQAPVLTPKYEVGTDPDTGYSVVSATFYPTEQEKFAEITPLTAGVASRQETVTDADGNEVQVVRYYYVFLANGSYTFTYEDDLGNVGTARAQVNALTIDAARVLSAAWYGTRQGAVGNVPPQQSDLVNRDITAQLRMSKAISDVELFVYDESAPDHCGAKLDADAPVQVSFNASNIDIVYTDNVDYQVQVRFTASGNGRKGTYTLPAVTCIDKSMPQVTLKSAVLSADKRSITFTLESSEDVVHSLALDKGYATTHQWIARDNKPVTLYFTDKAGNQLSYQVTDFAGMDLVELEASYSASADGANPTDEPAIELELKVGSSLFVYVNKTARANLNGTDLGLFKANAWNELVLPEDAGVYILELTDVNTGDTLVQSVFARAVDRIAPVIKLDSTTVLVHRNDSAESMLAAIRDGVTVTDNVDADLDFTVTGYPETTEVGGLYSLTYTARDSAGNKVSADRYLYIIDEKTPILWINGEVGLPYSTVYLSGGDVELTMENMDELQDQPVVIKLRKGLHTTGQMKYYATTVEDMAFQVTETGHYTIYVRGQDRTEFVTYIYVEG